jgi:hypothetical protein
MSRHTMAQDYEGLAKEAAGNWRKFKDFAWHGQPDQADKWCIVYTHNRDSGLLKQSNAKAIEAMLKPYMGKTVIAERQNHWACGWVGGYAIKVYLKNGQISKAFQVWCDIQEGLANYPVLDDEDYSEKEHEATTKNIEEVARRIANRYDIDELPPNAVSQLWDELSDLAKESRDDYGGYPSDEEMGEAFLKLDWITDSCDQCPAPQQHHCHCHHCNKEILGVVTFKQRIGVGEDRPEYWDVHVEYPEGVLHPIETSQTDWLDSEPWRFCSMRCYVDGYGGKTP